MDYLHYLAQKIVLIFEPTTLKIAATVLFSIATFFFGSLYTEALIAIVVLMVMDTFLGVVAAYHNNDTITSSKFSRAVLKGIVYFTSISAGYFADITVPYEFIQSTMIGFIGITEFISILENIGKMGYQTPKKLLNTLKDDYYMKPKK